jgi:hypothetical protein
MLSSRKHRNRGCTDLSIYELVAGKDGKPVELGRGVMGVTYKAQRRRSALAPADWMDPCRHSIRHVSDNRTLQRVSPMLSQESFGG